MRNGRDFCRYIDQATKELLKRPLSQFSRKTSAVARSSSLTRWKAFSYSGLIQLSSVPAQSRPSVSHVRPRAAYGPGMRLSVYLASTLASGRER
jgi:hypothetical protein